LAMVGTPCEGFEVHVVNTCNQCADSTDPCVYNTTTTAAP
jgi:hypothetical protein